MNKQQKHTQTHNQKKKKPPTRNCQDVDKLFNF